jgi:GNAT superfamily N-acetyltransferase
MSPLTGSTIDAFWAAHFGCTIQSLLAPGTRALPHAAMEGYQGAFLFCRGSACLVSAPPALVATAARAIAGRAPQELVQTEFLSGVFGSDIERVIGPAWLGYADPTDFRPAPLEAVRLLEPDDERALRRLAEECDATEWEHSGLEFDRPPVYGCFRGSEIASAAGYELWGEKIAHVGVVTHPVHRGQGFGKAVVSGIAGHALRDGLIAQYRTLQSNLASMAIGRVLGFREYAVTLAVRFRETPVPDGSSAGPFPAMKGGAGGPEV